MRFYSRLLSLRSDNIVHPLTKTHHVLSPFCSFLDLQCQQTLCNSNIISISVSMETIPLLLISRTHTHRLHAQSFLKKDTSVVHAYHTLKTQTHLLSKDSPISEYSGMFGIVSPLQHSCPVQRNTQVFQIIVGVWKFCSQSYFPLLITATPHKQVDVKQKLKFCFTDNLKIIWPGCKSAFFVFCAQHRF